MNSIVSQPDFNDPVQAMPPFGDGPPLSHFEFWPAWKFYTPVWFWIGCQMIRYRSLRAPLAANPGFPAGGLVGERKSELFAKLRGPERKLLPDYIVVRRLDRDMDTQWPAIMTMIETAGLDYPLVAKPDIGCRGAGVRPVRSAEELRRYIEAFPKGEKLIIQQMVDEAGEAGVFYVREPGAKMGEIHSLTLKYFPEVTGDGHSTLRQLIMADPRAGAIQHLYTSRFGDELDRVIPMRETKRLIFSGSHSKGAIFRNGNIYITEAMRARFDAIADAIDGFHFGRFDVRFADFKAFQRGEDFAIIEFNGAGAEMTHIWDSRMSLIDAWATLFRQYSLLFKLGAANRRRGVRPESWRNFFRLWQREKSLVKRYPHTG